MALALEDKLRRLEEIVRRLEEKELPLAEALRLYEEGVSLVKTCEELLRQAKERVEILTPGVEP